MHQVRVSSDVDVTPKHNSLFWRGWIESTEYEKVLRNKWSDDRLLGTRNTLETRTVL